MGNISELPGSLFDLLADAAAAAGVAGPDRPRPGRLPAVASLEPGEVVLVAVADPLAALGWFAALIERGLVPALAAGGASRERLAIIAQGIGAGAVIRSGPGGIAADPGVPAELRCRRVPGEVVILTSGTSGLASGVVHRLDRLLENGRRHQQSTGHRPGDRLLVSLPVYYSFSLVAQVLGAVANQARVTFDGPPFSAARFCAVIGERKVDSASVTPRLVPELLRVPSWPASLRVLTVGGSRLPADLLGRLLAATAAEVFVTYGLTEAGPRVSTLAARDEPAERYGSVGRPLPGVQVTAVPDTAGGGSELIVETDTRCVDTLGTRDPLPPGPLHTGDLGRVEDGYVWVEGRRRDVAVVGGEKVLLPDLEAMAESLPGVQRARFSPVGPAHDADALVATLLVSESASDDPGGYRRQLARVLRRVELPREVFIERGSTEWRK